ncbi:hypothetical protein [Streptomyces sp. NPDC051665]|uniref:hypothetical protein n=1 Tax=Streptomyces sp. NPDC051665 TaxID=3154647 RepID=UPI0034197A04
MVEGIDHQRVKLQEVLDVGMLPAYRLANEPALVAALTLSFHAKAQKNHGIPWPDWVEFNIDQLTEAKEQGELRLHIILDDHAVQISGAWSGLAFIGRAMGGDLSKFQSRVHRVARKAQQ